MKIASPTLLGKSSGVNSRKSSVASKVDSEISDEGFSCHLQAPPKSKFSRGQASGESSPASAMINQLQVPKRQGKATGPKQAEPSSPITPGMGAGFRSNFSAVAEAVSP